MKFLTHRYEEKKKYKIEKGIKVKRKEKRKAIAIPLFFFHTISKENGCIQWLKRLTNYSTDNLGRKDRSWPTFRVDSSVLLFRFATNVTIHVYASKCINRIIIVI